MAGKGGRPRKKIAEKRSEKILVSFTPDEIFRLKNLADGRSGGVANFVHSLATKTKIAPRKMTVDEAKIWKELADIRKILQAYRLSFTKFLHVRENDQTAAEALDLLTASREILAAVQKTLKESER